MAYSASLFAQMLSLLPRSAFDRIVHEFQGNRYTKTCSCWDQLVSMLFCQLGQAHSLREICGGLATSLGTLSHLGVCHTPKLDEFIQQTNFLFTLLEKKIHRLDR